MRHPVLHLVVGGLQSHPLQCWFMPFLQLHTQNYSPASASPCFPVCVCGRQHVLMLMCFESLWKEVTLQTGRRWRNPYFPNSAVVEQIIGCRRIICFKKDDNDDDDDGGQRREELKHFLLGQKPFFYCFVLFLNRDTCFGWHQARVSVVARLSGYCLLNNKNGNSHMFP